MNNRKTKHLWMVEDVPASPTRAAGSYWTKIGISEENADGSWSLQFSAVPLGGRIQLRDPAPASTTDVVRDGAR